ncbi:MAG: hypothetical protein LUP91_09540 [Methylococcaceae bacterium]|nr:hypothetical protein [Methylococcaceae bacterium]
MRREIQIVRRETQGVRGEEQAGRRSRASEQAESAGVPVRSGEERRHRRYRGAGLGRLPGG